MFIFVHEWCLKLTMFRPTRIRYGLSAAFPELVVSFSFSFQFFTRLAAVFAEEVFHLLRLILIKFII